MAPSRFEVSRDEAPILAEIAGELGARIYVSHKFRAGKRYLDDRWGVEVPLGLWMPPARRWPMPRMSSERYEGTHDDRVRTMLFPYQFDACTETPGRGQTGVPRN